MSKKEFDKLFGLSTSLDEEKQLFINRIETTVFQYFEQNGLPTYDHLFTKVCYELGVNKKDFYLKNLFGEYSGLPSLNVFSKNNFEKTLRLIVIIYKIYDQNYEIQEFISKCVYEALDRSTLNLEVRWVNGIFYPSGAELLDQELIDTSLIYLEKFPNEKINLENALKDYYNKNHSGVINNCYVALEGLSKQILNNKKNLLTNKTPLLQYLKFSKNWNQILHSYLEYANDYARHASENRHDLKPEEVEAFLYLTCLIIRLIIIKIN